MITFSHFARANKKKGNKLNEKKVSVLFLLDPKKLGLKSSRLSTRYYFSVDFELRQFLFLN